MSVGLKRLGVIDAVNVRLELLPSLPGWNSKILNISSTPWRLLWILSMKHCIYHYAVVWIALLLILLYN